MTRLRPLRNFFAKHAKTPTRQKKRGGVCAWRISAFVIAPIASFAALACYDAGAPTPQGVAQGSALAATLACASCHGVDLSGSESPVTGTLAYAANLTPDPETGIGNWTDDDLARAIRTGKDDGDAALCTAMPHFTTLGDTQMNALVAYLRSLPAVVHDITKSACAPFADLDDGGIDDAGVIIVTDDASVPCVGYDDPSTPGHCHACSGATCQPNGCFGGYFCDEATVHCVPKPSTCE